MALEFKAVETFKPPADRARLVKSLVANPNADSEVEEAWAAEVKRRETELKMEVFPTPTTRRPLNYMS